MADDLYFGDASLGKRIFCAHATVTAPVIYSTAAGTGGPLLWNGSTNTLARLLAVGFGTKTASTVAGALGFTGAGGQTAAPSSTTAIEDSGNLYVAGVKPSCTPYRIGTVTNAGTFFLPFAQVTTGALTVGANAMNWLTLNRLITVPPASWVSVSGSATLTTGVFEIGLVWEEIPVA